jgi:hypothetical protein
MHGKLDLKLRRRHGRAEYKEGKHETIVDPTLFDAVQALRASRRRAGPARQPNAITGRVFLAARLVRCSVCGERLRANAGRGKPIYRDCSPERGIACSAHRRRIDAALVHAAISAFIAAIRLPDDWRARALAAAARDETVLHRQERRTALERKRARLKDLVKEGIIDTAEYRADVAAIDTELAMLAHETEEADLAAIAARLENLSALWDVVWVELDGKKVLGIQPADAYHRLGMALPAVWSFCGTDGGRSVPNRQNTRYRAA